MRLKLILTFLFLFVSALPAKDVIWKRLRSDHFELYTNTTEKKAREILRYFEQVCALQLAADCPANRQTRIIAFQDERSQHPYQPGESSAFSSGEHAREFIVVPSASRDSIVLGIHEFLHVSARRSRAPLAHWLLEGLQDLYSTLEFPAKGVPRWGGPLPARLGVLDRERPMPLDQMVKVEPNNPEYPENNRANGFHGTSWLLVHMMHFHPDYKGRFPRFLEAFQVGGNLEASFQIAFRKKTADVEKDLQTYLESGIRAFQPVDANAVAPPDGRLETPSNYDLKAALADLLPKNKALDAYRELARDNPQDAAIAGKLAIYLLRTNAENEDYARAAFQIFGKAYKLGLKDARALWSYARLFLVHKPEDEEILAILGRLLEADPGHLEARLQMGAELLKRGRPMEVLEVLKPVRRPGPEFSAQLFGLRAFAYLRLGEQEQARNHAELLAQSATTERHRKSASEILSFLSSIKGPPADSREAADRADAAPEMPIEGVALPAEDDDDEARRTLLFAGRFRRLTCSGDSAVLQLQVGVQTVRLRMNDPGRVKVKGLGSDEVRLRCGVQKNEPLLVRYERTHDADYAGEVREIEFRRD
jgi:tetratricopeptide (TPR) repeat protein